MGDDLGGGIETTMMSAGGTHPNGQSATALLERAGTRRALRPGQLLHVPGDACHTVDLVRNGEITLTHCIDGREIAIGSVGEGELVGAADVETWSSTAEAATATELICIPRPTFEHLVEHEVAVRTYLISALAADLRRARLRIADQCAHTTRQRIAAILVDRARLATDLCVVRTTQGELARLVGSTRESSARVLAGFRDEGTIETGRGWIRVLDVDRLRRAAGEVR